jgi:hypothetical protein
MLTISDFLPVAVDLELKHPQTNEPLGVSLKVVGPDSTEFLEAVKAALVRNRGKELTPDDSLNDNNEQLAALIVGWSSDEFFQGAYSKAAALALIANPGLGWLKRQVMGFVTDSSNFFRSGSGTG